MKVSSVMSRLLQITFAAACLLCLVFVSACQAESQGEPKGSPAATAAPAGDPVLAKIGKQQFTDSQLKEKYRGELFQAETKYYQARQQMLNRMIDDYLLEAEAKKRGTKVEALLQKEVEKKAGKITKKEVDEFFQGLKKNPRFAQKTLADVEPQIRQHLQRQKMTEKRTAYIAKLRKKAGVQVFLQPPLINVSAAGNPSRGPKNAPIQMIVFSDYQCPYCSKAEKTVEEVYKKYPKKIYHVFRDFPLAFHKQAKKAAEASQCANDQKKFWEYHNLLFDKKKGLEIAGLKEYAKQLKLDSKKFDQCLDSGKYGPEVDKDLADGQKVGVRGTPAFFINGRMISGAQPLEAFTKLIDEELARIKNKG